jgi:hypothetical protein
MRVPSVSLSRLFTRVPPLSATVLALPLLVNAHGRAWTADDERPDLKVELVNFPIAVGEREVQLRVTKVSAWWADATTMYIETVSPAGTGQDVRIENLDPGQSATLSYTLAGGCDGQVLRAEVAVARNYEGMKESNLDNNRVQAAACPCSVAGRADRDRSTEDRATGGGDGPAGAWHADRFGRGPR